MGDLNRELAKTIKKKILTERDGWDQGNWATTNLSNVDKDGNLLVEGTCGTTGCVAGWACMLTGKKIDWRDAEPVGLNRLQASRLQNGEYIEEAGGLALGLDDEQKGLLFHTYENDMVLEMLDAIIETGDLNVNEDRWYREW